MRNSLVDKNKEKFSRVNEAVTGFACFPVTSYTAQLNRKCGVPRERGIRINKQRVAATAAP
jgi:hypothetical protein